MVSNEAKKPMESTPVSSGNRKSGKKKPKAAADDFEDELLELESVKLTPKNPLLDESVDPTPLRRLGKWAKQVPVDVPVAKQFKDGCYPTGEILEYPGPASSRMTNAEKRQLEKISEDKYNDLRRAAEVHRQVRRFIQSVLRPGIKMVDLVHALEQKSKELIEADGLKCGWAFPTGCSLNDCAAHYTPNYGDNTVLKYGNLTTYQIYLVTEDICKIDFGTHVNGHIIDCAFTVAFDEQYDELIKATQEGTNAGLRAAGIDARVAEISAEIEEVISSHEVTINGVVYPVKPIRNLTGHSIGEYRIHSGKSIPIVRNSECTDIMEEGDLFAIETFASTGKGLVVEKMDCSHYMKDFNANFVSLPLKSARDLLKVINANFGTLAFCKRWIHDITGSSNLLALKNLVDKGVVNPYPPLCDIKGSFTSQCEHTILLRPTCKEIVSRGDDY